VPPFFRLEKKAALTLAILLACGLARAQEADHTQEAPPVPPVFSINGFGTIGMVHSSERRADFVATDLQRKGAGYSNDWSPYVDSRVGMQLNARFTPDLTGVVQVVSEQRYDGSFAPQVEWANVKYNITPDLSMRAGRIVLPSFLLSDARKVGYSSPWVRTPSEVYNLVPITNSDGIDFSYRQQFGDARNTIQASFGQGSAKAPPDNDITGKRGWGVFDTLEYGNMTFHVSYFRTRLTIEGTQDLEAMARLYGGSAGAALADKYGATDKPFEFYGAGASYETSRWFLMGEYGLINPHSAYGKRVGGYVSSGYRIGKVTPYVTYAFADVKSNTSDPGLPLPPAWYPTYSTIAAMNARLNSVLSSAPVQQTYSTGLRWDAYKNVAVKFQFDHSRLGDGSYGMLNNRQSGYVRGGSYNLISATIDFQF